MGKRLAASLEDCLQRLDRGEDLPDLLADNPQIADKLKPLLLVAMASRAFPVPQPSQKAQRLGRNRMLAEMNRLEIKKAFRKRSSIPLINRGIAALVKTARIWGLNRLAYSYRLAVVMLVLAISGGFFTLNASASSQPGDILYTFKLGLERAGLVNPVPEDLPSLASSQGEVDMLSGSQGGVYYLDHQQEGNGLIESFPEFDLGLLVADPVKAEQETDKDLKEAEKEEEKDLKEAEKEEDKDLKEAEKEADQDLKEAEKDQKDADKVADKILKEDEKDLEKEDKEKDKTK